MANPIDREGLELARTINAKLVAMRADIAALETAIGGITVTFAGLTDDPFQANKASIADGDKFAILDSAATDAPKHTLWSLVKSTLKTYFDTLYALATHTHTSADITDANSDATANTVAKRDGSGLVSFGLESAGTQVILGTEFQPMYGFNGGFSWGIQYPTLTANRVWTFPNATGNVALTASTTGVPDNVVGAATITSGTINNTSIGATTAGTGAFTTVTASGLLNVTTNGTVASFTDSGSNRTWRFSSGNLTPLGNNQSSLGTAGTRISNGYFVGVDTTNLTASGTVITTPGTRSGPGAIPITVSAVALTTTGVADALTLANGTNGQILTISHVSRGGGTGTAVLTPTTANGYTTITFTATGDSVTLQYHTTGGWHIVGSRGVTVA